MADKHTTPEAAAGASPRKRATPTIDLIATEVEPDAASGAPPSPHEESAADQEAASESEGPTTADGPRESWIKAPALAGGAAGAVLTMLVLFGLWLTGLMATRESAPAMRASDTQSIDALNLRIGKVEDNIAKLPAGDAGANERIAAVENSMTALGLTLAALNRRGDDSAANAAAAREATEKALAELRSRIQDVSKSAATGVSAPELDALQKRIVELEQSVNAAAKSAAAAPAIDTPARLALSAAALRDAAMSGAPFAAALAQARSLGADEKTLAPLEPFAATGLSTPAALAQELHGLLPAILKLSGAQAPQGGFLERLQANAGKLVRIRPVDAPPGDDASAVLARIELEAARNDINGALGDLAKLPDAARAPAQAWIEKAAGRQAALTAVRAFAAESARALGKP